MTDSFILPDAMRKVKADGLFDSIRRDLIADIEQKPSYITLKSSIESSMTSYLAEHQWSSSLKKSELRERARRHIETSTLIKDELPTLVNEFMQTSQEQLIQPRLTTFVTDYIDHIYQSIGCNHFFRSAVPSYTPSVPISTEPVTVEKVSPSTPAVAKVNAQPKPTVSTPSPVPKDNPLIPNPIKKKIPDKDKTLSNKSNLIKKKPSIPPTINPIRTEKKPRPSTSPTRAVETPAIQPAPESKKRSASRSPPPPIVRVASPLATSKPEPSSVRKKKRPPESKEETITVSNKKKRTKTDEQETLVSPVETKKDDSDVVEQKDVEMTMNTEKSETESRRSRSRRPNPKYSQADFETGDLHILEPSPPPPPPAISSSVPSKARKTRSLKSLPTVEHEQQESLPLDTPSSPQIDQSLSTSNISPEYGAQLSASTDISETNTTKKSTSPRRLRPRKTNERSSVVDGPSEKLADPSVRTSIKTQDNGRHRSDTNNSSLANETVDSMPNSTKKTASTTHIEQISQESASRSVSAPDHSATSTDEGPTTRSSSTASSKSFIWKPKISK